MTALLAAERYRLRHGCWPDTLNALVPDYLHEVPLDPWSGKPLAFNRFAGGIMIFPVDAPRIDDGRKLCRGMERAAGTNLGFKLLDPQYRRQAPLVGPPEVTQVDETNVEDSGTPIDE